MSSPANSDLPESARPSADLPRPWLRSAGLVVLCFAILDCALFALLWSIVRSGYLTAWLSPANIFLWRFCILAVSFIFLHFWFVRSSPAPRKIRLTVAGVSLALVVGLLLAFRIDGVSGDIEPHLTFRWTPKPDARLARPTPGASGSDSAEDARVVVIEELPSDSPEFLGRGRRATVEGVKLATDWAAQPPRGVWGPQPIGAGWSGFSLVGSAAFTQEQRGDDELVTCYDAKTGKLKWFHADPLRFNSVMGGDGPRGTPTVERGRLYALSATGLLNCLDASTGKLIWKTDIVADNGAEVPQWGKSCSPLLLDGLVVVSAGGPGGRSLVAYDKETGKRVWGGGDDKSAYASPVLMTLAGTPQIVIVNALSIASHDPADGHVLWTHPWPGPDPSVSQPVAVGDDRVFVSKGYGGGCQLWEIKHEPDGKWTVDVVWKNLNMRTKFTNVVVREGYVYGLDEGILACVELKDGSRRWKQGRYGHGQILLVGDLILVLSDTGELALVEASPAGYKELGRFTALTGKTWNNPALSGSNLFVRNAEEAACYELPLAPAP